MHLFNLIELLSTFVLVKFYFTIILFYNIFLSHFIFTRTAVSQMPKNSMFIKMTSTRFVYYLVILLLTILLL